MYYYRLLFNPCFKVITFFKKLVEFASKVGGFGWHLYEDFEASLRRKMEYLIEKDVFGRR